MTLKVYNTLNRCKEPFEPVDPRRVGVYCCGITAYDSCHLGHARAAICFDVIVRYLRHKGYPVTYIRNYTDVDDKIINRAGKEKRTCREISEQYISEYQEDMASLHNIPPDIEPRATEHIAEMIEMIKKLIDNGYAYERNGDVFFSVRKFRDYGRLSGKNIDELESGARIDVNEAKDDPLDFALWKASKPKEPKWPSPWGEGRPGWHIECSSMSSKYLGQPFDIHAGGRDLVFPHHENEIAQAEGAEGKRFVKYWLHNGFININAEKMSKSLGNFMTIKDVVQRHGAETVRYFIVSNHYRSPIDYTEKALQDASLALDRFYETARRLPEPTKEVSAAKPDNDEDKIIAEVLDRAAESVDQFMDDDFNSAGAIGAIFEVVRSVNRYLDGSPDPSSDFYQFILGRWQALVQSWSALLGIFDSNPTNYFELKKTRSASDGRLDPAAIEALLVERKKARANRNFARADEIRDQLNGMGIAIKDRPDGTTEWQVK